MFFFNESKKYNLYISRKKKKMRINDIEVDDIFVNNLIVLKDMISDTDFEGNINLDNMSENNIRNINRFLSFGEAEKNIKNFKMDLKFLVEISNTYEEFFDDMKLAELYSLIKCVDYYNFPFLYEMSCYFAAKRLFSLKDFNSQDIL